MAEDIQGLIEKIQQEGVNAAETQAREIEIQARERAERIIQDAQAQAQQLVSNARDEIVRMKKSANASIQQAGRDLLLSLREEINAMLKKIIAVRTRTALSPEEMSRIITALIKETTGAAKKGEIIVTLNEKDLKKIEKSILDKLADEVKKGVALRSSDELAGGFTISYDGGKSHFDWTEKAIAEYLASQLKPELAELLKG